MWPLGILLLVGTLVGGGWVLNGTTSPGADNNKADREDPREIFCMGFVDVEKGVARLYPKQAEMVAEVAETTTKHGKERVFKKGEVLLRLKSQMAEFQLDRAKAAMHAAVNDLAKAKLLVPKHKIDVAKQDWVIKAYEHEKNKLESELKVKKKTYEDNVGELGKQTLKAMEEAVAAIDARIKIEELSRDELKLFDPELDIKRAEADLEAKKADVKRAELSLKDFVLEAPADGVVLRVNARVGEVLAPNPMASPAIEFCPSDPRIVRAEVIQEWGHRVKVGQEVKLEDDSFEGPKWQGRVKSVPGQYAPKKDRIIEPFMMNDVRTLECIVEITGGQDPLRIGQRVRVRIKI
jgi:multidrug resistance efflux pump